MSDRLVPEGTLILRRDDLAEVGRVTRATATSAWVGKLRLVKAGWGSDLTSHGRQKTDYLISDSNRHRLELASRARQVQRNESIEAYREVQKLRDLTSNVTNRRDDESHEQHMARLKCAVDALRAALGGADV